MGFLVVIVEIFLIWIKMFQRFSVPLHLVGTKRANYACFKLNKRLI